MMKLLYSLFFLLSFSHTALSQKNLQLPSLPETQRCYYAFEGYVPGNDKEASLLRELGALPSVTEVKLKPKDASGQAELQIRFRHTTAEDDTGFSPARVKELLLQYNLQPGNFIIRED